MGRAGSDENEAEEGIRLSVVAETLRRGLIDILAAVLPLVVDKKRKRSKTTDDHQTSTSCRRTVVTNGADAAA